MRKYDDLFDYLKEQPDTEGLLSLIDGFRDVLYARGAINGLIMWHGKETRLFKKNRIPILVDNSVERGYIFLMGFIMGRYEVVSQVSSYKWLNEEWLEKEDKDVSAKA